jgi:hypothetical protein
MPTPATEANTPGKVDQAVAKEGLQDVIAGHTAICHVFGGDKDKNEPGRLIYRGTTSKIWRSTPRSKRSSIFSGTRTSPRAIS